jgi:hypothetical protein
MSGLCFSVDCGHIQLPPSYLVLSTIMLLPNFITLLKNCHKIYAMIILMQEYTIMDYFHYVLLVLFILLMALTVEPHRTLLTDGMLLYNQVESTRFGRYACCTVHSTLTTIHVLSPTHSFCSFLGISKFPQSLFGSSLPLELHLCLPTTRGSTKERT